MTIIKDLSNKNVDFQDVKKWQAENFLSFNALTRQIRKVDDGKQRHSDLWCETKAFHQADIELLLAIHNVRDVSVLVA